MTEKDFSYLKPTDLIIVVRDGNKKVRQVEKITPSGLIRVSGVLYYPNGRERTSSIWHSSRLIPYNKETALVIEQDEFISKLVKRLHNININSITFEQATAISNVLDKKSLT